jgi:hypothetical protein
VRVIEQAPGIVLVTAQVQAIAAEAIVQARATAAEIVQLRGIGPVEIGQIAAAATGRAAQSRRGQRIGVAAAAVRRVAVAATAPCGCSRAGRRVLRRRVGGRVLQAQAERARPWAAAARGQWAAAASAAAAEAAAAVVAAGADDAPILR